MELLDEVLMVIIQPESQQVQRSHTILNKSLSVKYLEKTYVILKVEQFVYNLWRLGIKVLLYDGKDAQNKFYVSSLICIVQRSLSEIGLGPHEFLLYNLQESGAGCSK